ncbi:unnamed protein product, partial [Discosporangium mesarthrocarpum]
MALATSPVDSAHVAVNNPQRGLARSLTVRTPSLRELTSLRDSNERYSSFSNHGRTEEEEKYDAQAEAVRKEMREQEGVRWGEAMAEVTCAMEQLKHLEEEQQWGGGGSSDVS